MHDDPTRHMPPEPDPRRQPQYGQPQEERDPYRDPYATQQQGYGGGRPPYGQSPDREGMSGGVKAALIVLSALVVGLGIALAIVASGDEGDSRDDRPQRARTVTETETQTETETAPPETTTVTEAQTTTVTETVTETTTVEAQP